jgi:hypothetical protein
MLGGTLQHDRWIVIRDLGQWHQHWIGFHLSRIIHGIAYRIVITVPKKA